MGGGLQPLWANRTGQRGVTRDTTDTVHCNVGNFLQFARTVSCPLI